MIRMVTGYAMLLACSGVLAANELAADEAVFVEKGKAIAIRQVGAKWEEEDGGLLCGGKDNYLVAGKAVGEGDFTIRARVSLEQLNGTAASLVIGGNHFGFDGAGKTMFMEGPAFGATQPLGDAADFIAPGEPFRVEVARKGKTLTFRVDGKEVYSGKHGLAPGCAFGFRPWRATMRVYDFSASGDLKPVTEEAIHTTQKDHKKAARPRARRAGTVDIGGLDIDPASPPEGLALHPDIGILAAEAVKARVIYHGKGKMVWVPRATITPEGDYLVLFPYDRGRWYQGKEMLAMRSSDKGKTWSEPAVVFDSSQSHHGFVPLIPRGSKRIYAFGTQPISGMVGDGKKGLQENCPIGFRYSDDDGHTWSDVTLIRPENDPEFTGMSCVRMCETDAGTWLIGSHDGIWRRKGSPAPVTTRQYILRGEDKGKTWQLLPGKRPGGWCIEKYDRMDEGTVLSLGGAKAVVFIRTAEGRIWESRSDDDGKTWTDPKPTELVHPDAPPMVFHLGDAKTLIAFIHNRYDPRRPHFDKAARNEVWCSLSKDEGRTWSEPRFVFAGANPEGHIHSNSYLDMIADGSRIHVFLGQKGRQLLYLQFDESDLSTFMTKAGLAAAMKPSPETADGVERTALFQAGEDGYAVFRIPGIVVTAKGTVLAYCVGRKTPGDWADIDIFLRRSADGGKTWEPRRKLGDADAATVDNPTAIVDHKTGAVHMVYQVNYARAFYMRSDDDGRTFSEPVDITSVFEKFREDYNWNVIAPGPGHGIQLANGRLVVPVWLSTGGRRHRPSIVSVIYSDDHGSTWQRGDIVCRNGDEVDGGTIKNPSETVVVQLTDGRVMLNIRNESGRHRRLVSLSADGATGWTQPVFDEELFEPICFGSIQRFSAKPEADENRILFVNPNSGSRARRNLTVRLSYDEGKSWPVRKVLDPGIAGYPDLAVGPDGAIYCIYECGGQKGNHFLTEAVTVAKVSLEWLTNGKDHSSKGTRQ